MENSPEIEHSEEVIPLQVLQKSFKRSIGLLQDDDEVPLLSITGKRGTLMSDQGSITKGTMMRRETVRHLTLTVLKCVVRMLFFQASYSGVDVGFLKYWGWNRKNNVRKAC